MSEAPQHNPETKDKRVHDREKAHGLAIEGNELESEKVKFTLAKRALETAFVTGESPEDVMNRAMARDRVNPNVIREFGQSRPSEMPAVDTSRYNMMEARQILLGKTGYDETLEKAEHVDEFLEASGITEKIHELDGKLGAVYEKKPVTEDQKDRAKQLGHNPDNMRLL